MRIWTVTHGISKNLRIAIQLHSFDMLSWYLPKVLLKPVQRKKSNPVIHYSTTPASFVPSPFAVRSDDAAVAGKRAGNDEAEAARTASTTIATSKGRVFVLGVRPFGVCWRTTCQLTTTMFRAEW